MPNSIYNLATNCGGSGLQNSNECGGGWGGCG
jgi:hypothetical protein